MLNDKVAYGLGVAKNFSGAAKAVGIKVTGFIGYDPKQANFQALFTRIKSQNPDAVFIGGLIDENSGQLINDKVKVLGRQQHRQADAARTASRPTRSSIGRRAGRLRRPARFLSASPASASTSTRARRKMFINGFKAEPGGKPVDLYAILGPVRTGPARRDRESDGSRPDAISKVFASKVNNGLIGSFGFNKNGDLAGAKGAAVLFTIYTGTNHLRRS